MTCSDVNECADESLFQCDPNAKCVNKVGNYDCQCLAGYKGDGKTCINLDECALGIDSCDSNAQCSDTDGSFTCTCNAGYEGDGMTCYFKGFDFEDGDQGWTANVDLVTNTGATETAANHWSLASSLPGTVGVVLGSTWWTNPNNGSSGADRSHVTSPPLTATCTNPSITFDSFSSNESGLRYDAEHVQLSINDGPFTDIHGSTPELHNNCDQMFRTITFTSTPASSLVTTSIIDSCLTLGITGVVAVLSSGGHSTMLGSPASNESGGINDLRIISCPAP